MINHWSAEENPLQNIQKGEMWNFQMPVTFTKSYQTKNKWIEIKITCTFPECLQHFESTWQVLDYSVSMFSVSVCFLEVTVETGTLLGALPPCRLLGVYLVSPSCRRMNLGTRSNAFFLCSVWKLITDFVLSQIHRHIFANRGKRKCSRYLPVSAHLGRNWTNA